MEKRCILTLWIFLFFYSAFALTVMADTAFFEDIKKTYHSIMTIEANFKQRIFISSLKKERVFEGDFLFKRNKGFLWSYNKPKTRYFLYDGRFIWQGDEEKPFIYKKKIDKEKTGGTFFDLIDDISKIDQLFTLKEKKKIGDMEILELLPKKEGQIISAKIWIDRLNMVKKLEMHEFTGNINIIDFNYKKINEPISDGKFVFKAEKGKEIIETH